jgi:RNA polymerase sigma factor (sigma-70 family)
MTSGDRVAFGEYVRSRSHALLRSAQALTGNRADAEDLVQATLVKAYQSWDRIDDAAALDTYVRRVMVNTHISGWRRRRVDEYPTDEIPDAPSAGDATRDSDLRDVVQRALDRLPRQMRAAVARAVAKLRNDSELGSGDQPGLQDPSLDPYPAGGVMRHWSMAISPVIRHLAQQGSG